MKAVKYTIAALAVSGALFAGAVYGAAPWVAPGGPGPWSCAPDAPGEKTGRCPGDPADLTTAGVETGDLADATSHTGLGQPPYADHPSPGPGAPWTPWNGREEPGR